jgi:hypothetical protein
MLGVGVVDTCFLDDRLIDAATAALRFDLWGTEDGSRGAHATRRFF